MANITVQQKSISNTKTYIECDMYGLDSDGSGYGPVNTVTNLRIR